MSNPITKAQLEKQKYIKSFDNSFINVYIFSDLHHKWVESKHQSRKFESIILPKTQKDQLLTDLNKFLTKESYYKKRDIPYRRGYLLHGPAGTGKTSIAIAMATLSGRPIYYMPMDLNIDAIMTIPHYAVVLLEDADKMILTDDPSMRLENPEPVSLSTAYPNINPSEHNIWLKAIRNNTDIIQCYKDNYCGLEANYDIAASGGVSLMESIIEGVLTEMKAGFAEPKKAKTKDTDNGPVEYEPGETEEEYSARRSMYKNIIREANRLRREHYDNVRFDQKRIGLLLQVIDGALIPYGAIFIMSTNELNNIHSALIRKGRMDTTMEIGYLNDDTAAEMLGLFNCMDKEIITKLKSSKSKITAADLQGALLDL